MMSGWTYWLVFHFHLFSSLCFAIRALECCDVLSSLVVPGCREVTTVTSFWGIVHKKFHHLQNLNVVIPLGIPTFCTGSATHVKQIVSSSCSEDSRIYDFLLTLLPVEYCLVLVVIDSTLFNGGGRHGGLNSTSGPPSLTQMCHSCAENIWSFLRLNFSWEMYPNKLLKRAVAPLTPDSQICFISWCGSAGPCGHIFQIRPHVSLWDISAITTSYTLINMYLFQFD